jgi:hypothetical protein
MKQVSTPRIKGADVLPVRMAVYVPSTKYDKDISPEQFQRRINQTVRFLNMFGGSTRNKETGSWNDAGNQINEKVVIVESFAKIKDYHKAKKKLISWLKAKRKEWKQKALSFEFEDDLIIVK